MENYYRDITNSLSVEDLFVLSLLIDSGADCKQKSIKNQSLYEMSNQEKKRYTEAIYRKIVDKLSNLLLVKAVKDFKEHSIYVTTYGINAVNTMYQILEGEGA